MNKLAKDKLETRSARAKLQIRKKPYWKILSDAMFLRDDGERWRASNSQKPLKKACKVAGISPVIGFHVLRHSCASLLICQRAPLIGAADSLGNADSRMTEKHYAHLAQSYVADTIRSKLPNFQIVNQTNEGREIIKI